MAFLEKLVLASEGPTWEDFRLADERESARISWKLAVVWSQAVGKPMRERPDCDSERRKKNDQDIIRRWKTAQGLDPDDYTIEGLDSREILIEQLNRMEARMPHNDASV